MNVWQKRSKGFRLGISDKIKQKLRIGNINIAVNFRSAKFDISVPQTV